MVPKGAVATSVSAADPLHSRLTGFSIQGCEGLRLEEQVLGSTDAGSRHQGRDAFWQCHMPCCSLAAVWLQSAHLAPCLLHGPDTAVTRGTTQCWGFYKTDRHHTYAGTCIAMMSEHRIC